MPKLPLIITVSDYHEFGGVQNTLRILDPHIKVEEINLDEIYLDEEAEFEPYAHCPYVGVVYKGRIPSLERMRALLDAGHVFELG